MILQYFLLLMVMERPLAAAMKTTPGITAASVGSVTTAAPFDTSILPPWSLASKFYSLLSYFFGSPFAIAVGPGATAHSNSGGAMAVSKGEGATATAVSNGGYAEAVAIGADTQCSSTANEGEIDIKKNERQEDGTVKNDEFKHPY